VRKSLGWQLLGSLGVLALAAGSAAAERTMVVLIDATGSMVMPRSDGQTRFEAARQMARERIINAASQTDGLASVAVYTFHSVAFTNETGGFVTPFEAVSVIDNLEVAPWATPLAGSLCDAIDIASASGTGAVTDQRLLEVFTDGEENATLMDHPCWGEFSTSTGAPFDAGSWQNKVYLRAVNASPSIVFSGTLFTNVGIAGFAAAKAAPMEVGLHATPSFGTFSTLLSDAEFFAELAAATGGTFDEVADTAPLPVFGDVDGDYDVDRDDAIALARRFGSLPLRAFDLDADGSIGWGDYALLLQKLGTGSGTPAPDPYTQAGVVSCGNNATVVLEGKVIEVAGITLTTQGKCNVVIRNSLIVSGSSALQVSGSARVTVDDSIIVGAGAWVSGNGSVMLSAANTVFHGAQSVSGTVKITDRGGNVFEP
jgi:hypothetical protein